MANNDLASKLYKFSFWFFIALTAIYIFLAIWVFNSTKTIVVLATTLADSTSAGVNVTDGPMVPQTPEIEKSYLDDAVLVGDLVPTGFLEYKFVDKSRIVSNKNMNLVSIATKKYSFSAGLMTVAEAIKAKKAKNIYLSMGTNDIPYYSVEDILSDYTTFLREVKKQNSKANIFVMGITPVDEVKHAGEKNYNNINITKLNDKLQKLALDNDIYYLEIGKDLVNTSGNLAKKYSTPSGYNLSYAAYPVILKHILTRTVK